MFQFPLRTNRVAFAFALSAALAASYAADQTVSGNLTVTGTADIDGNSLTVGTQGSSPGLFLSYTDATVDTLTLYLNRNPGSFLWAHSSAISAMRLTGNHELELYDTAGTVVGLKLSPQTSTIAFGSATLYRDSATGALRTGGAFTVDGAVNFASTFTTPAVTGGTTGLTLSSGAANQNITLTPQGSGYTILNGKVGIGTSTPSYKLTVDNGGTGTAVQIIGSAAGSQTDTALDFALWNAVLASYGRIGIRAINGVQGNESGDMWFATTNGGAVTERLRIKYDGKIGIGTTTPTSDLSLVGSLPSILLRDTGQTLPAGQYVISSQVDRLGFYRGVFGVNAYEQMRIDATGVTSYGGFAISGLSAGHFTGTRSTYFPSTGASYINNGGNLGIGTATPSERLEVAGNIKASGRITATDQFTILNADHFPGGWVRGADMRFKHSNGTYRKGFANGIYGSGDTLHGTYFSALEEDNSPWTNSQLFLSSSGKIGVGTSSPTERLDVVGKVKVSSSSGGLLVLNNSVNAGNPGSLEVNNDGNRATPISARLTYGTDNTGWQFRIAKNHNGTVTDQLTIRDHDGAVGIGTTAPSATERLEVNGNTKVVGRLSASSGRFDGPVRIAPQGDLSMGSFTTEP